MSINEDAAHSHKERNRCVGRSRPGEKVAANKVISLNTEANVGRIVDNAVSSVAPVYVKVKPASL